MKMLAGDGEESDDGEEVDADKPVTREDIIMSMRNERMIEE